MKGSAKEHEKDDRYDWCGHHGGFVPAVRRIQPMLELFETGSILGVTILKKLFKNLIIDGVDEIQNVCSIDVAPWISRGITV